jgi:hypothetical protein
MSDSTPFQMVLLNPGKGVEGRPVGPGHHSAHESLRQPIDAKPCKVLVGGTWIDGATRQVPCLRRVGQLTAQAVVGTVDEIVASPRPDEPHTYDLSCQVCAVREHGAPGDGERAWAPSFALLYYEK